MGGLVTGPLFAKRGIPAGSKFSGVCVHVYVIEAFDTFIVRQPCLEFDVCVDDITAASEGSAAHVLETTVQGPFRPEGGH